jgi:acetolactate synthase-1/2/3 large subunit
MLDFNYEHCKDVRSYFPNPVMDVTAVESAAALLNEAKKPYILVGQGIILSNAEQEILAFAEKSGIPVASTLLGLGAFPPDHELYVGYLGMHGNYAPNILTNEADVILAVGMRFDDRVTGDVSRYAKQAKIIHIDIDAAELNKIVKNEVSIHADAKEALALLTQKVEKRTHDAWLKEFRDAEQKEKDAVINEAIHPSHDKLQMAEVVNRLSEITDGKAIVVTDVGQHQMVTSRYYQYKANNTNVTSGGLGTMGFALPAAIGAKLGAPEKTVVAIIGDGGFQMTIQELGTILQFGVDVKILILNNNFLGMVRQWQELFFDKRYSFTDIVNPNFLQIAKGYNIDGLKITTRKELDGGLETMLNSKGSFLLEVVVEREENVFPMVPTGASVSEIRLN